MAFGLLQRGWEIGGGEGQAVQAGGLYAKGQGETLSCEAKQEHRACRQTALAGWKPALPGAGKKSTGLPACTLRGQAGMPVAT